MSERLTEWTGERWIARPNRLNGKIIGDRDIYAKLAHFEDLQEQGQLVELPFKKGTTIYWIENKNNIRSAMVRQYGYEDGDLWIIADVGKKVVVLNVIKNLFDTYETAQEAL